MTTLWSHCRFAHKQVISRTTCSLIQGKKHFLGPSATFPAQQVVTSNATSKHIQGRSSSVVISVTIHPTKLVILRSTCGSILGKNPLHANSATSHAEYQAMWRGICSLTLVRNHTTFASLDRDSWDFYMFCFVIFCLHDLWPLWSMTTTKHQTAWLGQILATLNLFSIKNCKNRVYPWPHPYNSTSVI